MDVKYHSTSQEGTLLVKVAVLLKNAQEGKPVTTALGVILPLLH